MPALAGLPDVFLASSLRGLDADEAPDLVAIAVAAPAGATLPSLDDDAISALIERTRFTLEELLARTDVTGDVGQLADIALSDDAAPGSLLLLGVGDATELSLRRAGAALGRRLRGRAPAATSVVVSLPGEPALSAPGLRAFVEGLLLGHYRQTRRGQRAPGPDDARLRTVRVLAPSTAAHVGALRAAVATAAAATLARDLANTTGDVKDPAWLADRAVDLGAGAGLEVRVRAERELAADGFGGILAVGAGSVRPPRFVELAYAPAKITRGTPHVALVGKGITFDSGGLSLKPREAMVPMKTDMSGAGAVLAVMSALGDLGVRARVTGLLAIAENLPSGSAARPGDVITHFAGTTSEVLNTDAEGRLVLADALAYADTVLGADIIIDIATLTGAASLGLGRRHGAMFTADEALADALLAAGEASGERLWRMPLTDAYRDELRSDVADLRHIARTPGGAAGATTAALFLQEFTGRRRWVHLDVAGPARADSDEHEVSKGGTGFGTRVLLRWLESLR